MVPNLGDKLELAGNKMMRHSMQGLTRARLWYASLPAQVDRSYSCTVCLRMRMVTHVWYRSVLDENPIYLGGCVQDDSRKAFAGKR